MSAPVTGSPFQFTVGPLSDGGAHRVHAGGSGLERGEQGQPCEFNVWTREAGPGSLAISVEGPSKAEIDFKDRKDGSCYVSYVVNEPGIMSRTSTIMDFVQTLLINQYNVRSGSSKGGVLTATHNISFNKTKCKLLCNLRTIR